MDCRPICRRTQEATFVVVHTRRHTHLASEWSCRRESPSPSLSSSTLLLVLISQQILLHHDDNVIERACSAAVRLRYKRPSNRRRWCWHSAPKCTSRDLRMVYVSQDHT